MIMKLILFVGDDVFFPSVLNKDAYIVMVHKELLSKFSFDIQIVRSDLNGLSMKFGSPDSDVNSPGLPLFEVVKFEASLKRFFNIN